MRAKSSGSNTYHRAQPVSRALSRLHVALRAGERFRGRLIAGTVTLPCVLGPGGVTHRKREGDGATPAGTFRLVRLMFRSDRVPVPQTHLPSRASSRRDGWCDDVRSSCYNRPVALPHRAGHEVLWRDDPLYDLVVVLDYNLRPARKGRGSAIFLHVRFSPDKPTAGCVAVEAADLRRLLGRIGAATRITIT